MSYFLIYKNKVSYIIPLLFFLLSGISIDVSSLFLILKIYVFSLFSLIGLAIIGLLILLIFKEPAFDFMDYFL